MQQKITTQKKNIDKQNISYNYNFYPNHLLPTVSQYAKVSTKNGELNPYIPRYILETPRYQQDIINKSPEQEDAQDQTTTAHDPLAHQRKTGEIIDNSIAQSGTGIKDEFKGTIRVEENESYDSKRDRWYGYSTEEWLTHLKNWNDKSNLENMPQPKIMMIQMILIMNWN